MPVVSVAVFAVLCDGLACYALGFGSAPGVAVEVGVEEQNE